jgi:cytochrome c5
VTYGISYTSNPIGDGTHHESMTQPIYYYLPSEAISPLTVYRGTMFHEWEGDILVGALKAKHVSKIDFDEGVIRSESTILTEINDRIRDIKVAHDGSIYILSQKGEINRLFRETQVTVPIEDDTAGALIYEMACAGCHDNGAYNSPVLGNSSQWEQIIKQPLSLTYKHTIEGNNLMPPRGYCNICSDEQLKRAVNYMLEQAQQQ